MDFSSINHHHNRYVPHPQDFSDDRLYPHHHHHHHRHHLQPPPPPPPPSYPPPLRSAPPPPPPHNSHQTQFTFLNNDSRNPHLFSHHSPPPRVSNRTLFEDNHRPRIHLPEFDRSYPDPRSDSWADPPRISNRTPTRPVPLGFDHESPLHRRPFSPYRTSTDNYDRDFERSSSFRDEFVDGYRDHNRDQFLWGQKNSDGDNDNYRRGHDSDHYISNSDRSRSFEFDVDSHNASKVNISRESVADFVANVGNYVSSYGSRSDNDRSWDVRDEDRKWAYDKQSSREVADGTMGMENSEFDDGDEVAFVSARRLAHNYDSGKFNYRSREGREEFVCTPKKQIQKKSALLRIGKPNNRNRNCKAYLDDSNTSNFRGKDKDPLVYWDQRMEEETEGSPVEISFKSNALVAKAIMTPSSPAVVSDRNIALRNRNIRKETLSDSPPVQFGERSVKSDNSTHGSDCPSSSEKTPTQSPEKVTVSGIGSVSDIVSLPCSSGTDNSAGSSAVKGSPKVKVTDLAGNSDGSNGTPSYRLRKKRKIATLTSHETSLQPTKKVGEPVDADGFTNHASAPDHGVSHSKEKITSAGMVMVHDVVSLPSLNELIVNEVHESPQAIVLEKDDADVGTPCLPDTNRNSTTHHLSSSSPLETKIDKRIENADRSVHDLQFVSNSDQVLTEIQIGSTVSDIGRVDDSSHHPCQNGVPLLLENGIVKRSSECMVSVEGRSNGGLSSPEEIDEGTVDSHASVRVVCNALNFDFGFIKRQENITVSGIDFVDAGPKQSSISEVSTPPENGIMEGSLNAVPAVGGYGILGLSNAEENKIHEGISNADSFKYDFSTTSSSNSGHTNFQGNNIVSNSCLVDDTSKRSCLDGGTISLENVLVNGWPKAKVLEGDNSNVCSGKDHNAKVKGEDMNIQLGLSSPRASDKSVNGVTPLVDVDTTFSCSVKDLVTTEEEVTGSGAGNFDVGSQPCTDGGSFLHGNRINEGSSEVDLSIIGGVDGGPNGTSPKCKKKREVFAPPEKLVSEGGCVLFYPTPSLDNSTINMKSGPVMVSDLSLNTKSASFTSEDTHKTSLNLNPIKGELNLSLRRNQPSSALPRVPTSHPSTVFSRKTAPTNHNSKPRTWHRTVITSASPIQAKKSYSSPVPPQKLSPKKVGKVQGSAYIRKGNSLVRKPAPVKSLPHGSHSSSSSVYRLNPLGIDDIKKSSGSESRVDVIDSATCLRTGGLSAPFERPRTPPLPCSTKLLTCPTTYSGDLTSLPLENHPPNDCSETTSDPLELAENLDVPKFTEDASTFSGAPEYQTGSTNNLGSERALDEGKSGKKILYVKRKSNQLVASSNSSDLSVQGVDKTPALSSDGYYKRRKNQLIRTSLESHIMQRVPAPDETSNGERRRVPKDISSSSSKRQFSKGFAKLCKPSKFSPVWTLHNSQLSRKYVNSLQRQMGSHLFPWKRATYSRGFMQHSASISNNSSLSLISRKLLLSRKRETIYTRSTHGFSLRISKLLSVGGSSLKWSKSIERNSKRANEEATLAVAAVEKKKREQIAAACVVAGTKSRNHFSRKSVHSIKPCPGERIYRIGSVRYKMDPSRRTLQRISDKEPSCSTSLQSEKDARKPYVPRRLLIGNDEYVRIGNGNQLIRDPKKRTRTLASEKVRWSLHTARLRLARKRKYCQFFTRFGKCNKDDGKCPYIHDPSKIAVCTKFLNGSCSDPKCRLTHKVIPERMQDCSYFLQGLCSNENCPYRHVNVNPNASICEGFLKGYCADSNECRKKHTYVCPVFKATGICPQGSKCKLHHPKSRSKGMKRKPSREQKNTQGRYFGSRNFDIAECRTAVSENHYSKDDDDIFCQEGKFADYITLDVSDKETGGTNNSTSEQRTMYDSDNSDLQVSDLEELTKPIRIMKKKLKMTESSLATA